MTTQAAIGYGAKLELFDSSQFVTIGEVTKLTPPNLAVDSVDATHMVSEGAAREFIAGLINYGDIKVEMNLVPDSASDDLIRTLLVARAAVQWRITLPPLTDSPNHILDGEGIITGYETDAPVDGKMVATLTIKVSGPVNYSS
jgi:predicted secreted protein